MNGDLNRFVPNVVFEKIPIKNLVSNQDYQRSLSEQQILRAAEDFDVYQVNPVKVSRRDGINYVFDGQHTIEIIALVSQSRETPVWCMIYNDLHYQHEAQVFAEQQKHSRPLSPFDTFTAHIEAGSEKHVMIKKTVESYSLIINGTQKRLGTICAIATLEKIVDKYGMRMLDQTISLCVAAWEGDLYSLSANMLMGIARLIATYGDDLQLDIFKERLGIISPKVIIRSAKERRPGSLGIAETLLIMYNKRCKRKLSIRKLYGNSAADLSYDESEDEEDEDY